MKPKFVFYRLFQFGLLLTLLMNCKKEAIKTAPTVTISAVTNITATSATSGGDVTSDGGAPVTAKGICYSTTQDPTTSDSKTSNGSGTGIFTSSITGLNSGSAYYIRAYATNSVETAYSSQATFTTVALAPVLTTTDLSAIATTTASSGGNITNDGGSAVTARGVCWSTTQNPTTANSKTTDGTGTGMFISNLMGLTGNTTYYLRAYATNSVGTAYGTEVYFKTSSPASGTVTDIEGNVYHYITIGTQTWMVENLKTTKYRNGDLIAYVTDNSEWSARSTGAYCWYNNDGANYRATYGALYNWYAVADSRNIAPPGWHVSTNAEWSTLTDYLGGESVAGGKLKEAGTSHWLTPNSGAANSSGFTALPGGDRFYYDGKFSNGARYYGYWWSSTASDATGAWARSLYFDIANVNIEDRSKRHGYSVRCVRD